MGYYDHDEHPQPVQADPPGLAQQITAVFVRLLGTGLLVIGIWTAVVVMLEAWELYQDPARIERFADAIERGSNLDRALAPTARDVAASTTGRVEAAEALSLSYFVAWFIALALLLVIAMVAMSAVSTGGQLALYDLQVKRFSREVAREIRGLRRA